VVGAHAYAGAVISATTNVRVQGLVFIAALTPDEGETVADVFYRGAPRAQAPKLEPDKHGLIWLPEPSFTSAFAQDAGPKQAALLAATQRPISVACIQEKSPPPPLEAEARVVPRCDTGPHDQSGHSALHGDSYGRSHPNRGC
jgi:hypothetical protein